VRRNLENRGEAEVRRKLDNSAGRRGREGTFKKVDGEEEVCREKRTKAED
jgi:hypothetical protein